MLTLRKIFSRSLAASAKSNPTFQQHLVLDFKSWMEKELGVDISNAFVNHVFNSFTIVPPTLCIIIRTISGDHADANAGSKSFLEQDTSTSSVGTFSNDVEAPHLHVVLAQPIPERNRRTVGTIATHNMQSNYLNTLRWNTRFLK